MEAGIKRREGEERLEAGGGRWKVRDGMQGDCGRRCSNSRRHWNVDRGGGRRRCVYRRGWERNPEESGIESAGGGGLAEGGDVKWIEEDEGREAGEERWKR